MFISRTRYEMEKACAKYRIEQLEKIICPHGHSYKKIGEKTVAFDTLFGHDLKTPIYKCTKCGKESETMEMSLTYCGNCKHKFASTNEHPCMDCKKSHEDYWEAME